jgi:hypothetical protein
MPAVREIEAAGYRSLKTIRFDSIPPSAASARVSRPEAAV